MYPPSYGPVLHTVRPNENLYKLAQMYNTNVQSIIEANPGADLSVLYPGQIINIWPGYRASGSNRYEDYCEITAAEAKLKADLRVLWEQHVFWTRLTIISMVFKLPDADLVTNRLLRNPRDFETALIPIYGQAIAARFADLLTQHLAIAAQLVKAAMEGDNRAAAEHERIWYQNAREIAMFLGGINPFWSSAQWEAMLFKHLELTKSEAVEMINKNFQAEINLFDRIENQALMMADVMAEGIARQFPGRFGR